MSQSLRFRVGTSVLCNLGPKGWKVGTVIATNYREDNWARGKVAPYQVALLDETTNLIYVPFDDDRVCRQASDSDLKMNLRVDALASVPEMHRKLLPPPPSSSVGSRSDDSSPSRQATLRGQAQLNPELDSLAESLPPGTPDYRLGRCFCCHRCPKNWRHAEMYSEHYRAAERNGLGVSHYEIDLGTLRVGDGVRDNVPEVHTGNSSSSSANATAASTPHSAAAKAPPTLPVTGGFLQCPTLARLPPGLEFGDDGSLNGQIKHDPHRPARYSVEFVAVSASRWQDPELGLVRLSIKMSVVGNHPPSTFDSAAFEAEQEASRSAVVANFQKICETWEKCERKEADYEETIDNMWAGLDTMRELLEKNSRLDDGQWWAQLGGFHMNIHKLLENALFECELYLGYALTFGDPQTRHMAERNLEGCYSKRLLECARFLWIDANKLIIQGEYAAAIEICERAAAKKEGWGWAVNFGDIWMSQACAALLQGAASYSNSVSTAGGADDDVTDNQKNNSSWIKQAEQTLKLAQDRVGSEMGHPWCSEIKKAIEDCAEICAGEGKAQQQQQQQGSGVQGNRQRFQHWFETFKLRTNHWCATALAGGQPFPPPPRNRRHDALSLIERLPAHNSPHLLSVMEFILKAQKEEEE